MCELNGDFESLSQSKLSFQLKHSVLKRGEGGKRIMDNDVSRALSHRQRRRKLLALLVSNPQDELPIYLVNPPDSHIERHLQSREMVSVHLPLLDKLRFINWDVSQYEITKGPRFDELKPLLERLDDEEELSIE
jgi:hypothetical protein